MRSPRIPADPILVGDVSVALAARTGFHGAIVFSTQCAVTLVGVDPAAALGLLGVVAFYSAVDIPGLNTGGSDLLLFAPLGQTVEYIGTPVGVIIAQTQVLQLPHVVCTHYSHPPRTM